MNKQVKDIHLDEMALIELCLMCLFTKRQTIDLLGKDHKDLISKIFQDGAAEITVAKELCKYPYAHQVWCLGSSQCIYLLGKNIFMNFLWQHLNMDVVEQFATGVAFAMHHVQCIRGVSNRDMPYIELLKEVWDDELLSRNTRKFEGNPGRELIIEYLEYCRECRSIPTMPKNENELKNSLAAYGMRADNPRVRLVFYWSQEARALVDEMVSSLPDQRQRLLKLRFGLNGESAHTLKELSVAIDDSLARTTASFYRSIRMLRQPDFRSSLWTLLSRQYVFSDGEEVVKNTTDNKEIDSMKSLLDRRVDYLDFPEDYSARIICSLRSQSIFYISDLVQKTERELSCIPNLGTKSLKVLMDTLRINGLILGSDE